MALCLLGVGLHLGTVERHVADGLESRASTEPQHLDEKPAERFAMREPKGVDRGEVRMFAAGEHAKRHVLVGGSLDLARREHPRAVRVQQ